MDGPDIKIDMIAEQEVITLHRGKEVRERTPTSSVSPGATLIYTINLNNRGKGIARNVEVNNPIPEGATYVPLSARGLGSTVLVSTNHGRTFNEEAGGLLPETITDIRWTVDNMPAGSRRKVEFKVTASSRESSGLARLWGALYLWLLSAFSK